MTKGASFTIRPYSHLMAEFDFSGVWDSTVDEADVVVVAAGATPGSSEASESQSASAQFKFVLLKAAFVVESADACFHHELLKRATDEGLDVTDAVLGVVHVHGRDVYYEIYETGIDVEPAVVARRIAGWLEETR